MREIPAWKFKEQCLALREDVDPGGIVNTKRGTPLVKLISLGADSASLIGSLRGKLKIKGDIMSTGAKWHDES